MNYPLFVQFKKVALANQFTITDSSGELMCYVRQKMFKLKEDIQVFKDRERQNLIYNIKADRIIDFSAKYTFYNPGGQVIGAIKRKGARSIWRANYLIDSDLGTLTLKEDSVFTRFMDGFCGCCGGLFFNPSYTITKEDGTAVMKVKKMRSLFEAKFTINKVGEIDQNVETQTLLGAMLMLLLERLRG